MNNSVLPQNTAVEAASYSSNYSSPTGEYLVDSYSDLSPTDDVNCDHASTMQGYIGGYVQEMF
jgi:hypothetical protein